MQIRINWLITKFTDSLNRYLTSLNNEFSDKMFSGLPVNRLDLDTELAKKIRENPTEDISTEEIYELIVYLSLILLSRVNRN